jgi:dTDP-4-dehydrorhamnose reductase
MLRLARERDELGIVGDQFGAPTSSIELADATRAIVSGVLEGRFGSTEDWAGLYHMTCSGSTSWYGFASAIFFRAAGLLQGKVPVVKPITSADYVTSAMRPRNSVLSNERLFARFGVKLAPWESALDAVISRLTAESPTVEL